MKSAPTFEGIRYSRVWEDHTVLTRGLEVSADDDVLSICSAGCNVLCLALAGARSVTAVDVNPAQLALLGLHLAAIRCLGHAERLALVGVTEAGPRTRLALYERVRAGLEAAHVRYWDARADVIEAGVVDAGRFDAYVAGFRSRLQPEARALVEALATCRDLDAQAALVDRLEADAGFCEAFEDYYGTAALSAGGRAPDQYAHVDVVDTGAWFRERAFQHLRRSHVARNVYTRLFWTATYPEERFLPPHLTAAAQERLRRCADRIRLRRGSVEDVVSSAAPGTYSKVNLSDVFEYHGEADTRASLESLGESIRPGGRIVWWSLLVPRPLPEETGGLVARDDVASPLHEIDRVFFYRSFHVAERPPARTASR